MKKIKLLIALFFALYCMAVNASPPVVFAFDGKALEKNKARINIKDPLIMPAYKQLLKDADKALEFGPVSVMDKKNDPPSGDKHDYMSLAPYFWPDPTKPNGLPYMRKDGETNPEVKDYKDKDYMPKLCDMVNTLALAYYFSGENKYAEHAAELLRVWFLDKATRMNPNLNYAQAIKGTNDGRGAGLIDSRHFIKLTDAIGLMQDSKKWTNADQEGMKQWFTDFLNWMRTSKNGTDEMHAKNNHGDWYDAQRLSLALFTGNTALAKKIVLNAQDRLDKQMNDAGMFTLEMERTTSLHYNGFALQAFFTIAQLAEHTEIDLWNYISPSGKSLKKAFNAYYPYISRQEKWTGQQIKEFDFEEGIPLMMEAVKRFGCKDCIQYIKNI
jgi:hypothetical protein